MYYYPFVTPPSPIRPPTPPPPPSLSSPSAFSNIESNEQLLLFFCCFVMIVIIWLWFCCKKPIIIRPNGDTLELKVVQRPRNCGEVTQHELVPQIKRNIGDCTTVKVIQADLAAETALMVVRECITGRAWQRYGLLSFLDLNLSNEATLTRRLEKSGRNCLQIVTNQELFIMSGLLIVHLIQCISNFYSNLLVSPKL